MTSPPPPEQAQQQDQPVEQRVSLLLMLLAGLAGIAATLGLWWFGYQVGLAPFPPYDLADVLIRAAPGEVAVWAIANLQFAARDLAMLGGVFAFVAIGAGIALLCRQIPGHQVIALAAAGIGVTSAALALANNTTSGYFWPLWLVVWFAVTLAAPFVLLTRAIDRLHNTMNDRSNAPADWQAMNRHFARRDVVKSMASTALLLGGGGWFAGTIVRSVGVGRVDLEDGVPLDTRRADIEATDPEIEPLPTPVPVDDAGTSFDAPDGVRPRLTSVGDFYVIDINTRKPALSDESWTLRVHGLVDQQVMLSYRDLLNMPAVEQFGNLMCISFTYDNNLIGNTRWTGVPLRDVLAMAGVQDEAFDVVLRGAGGYTDSIRVEKAMDQRTLLAYGMDGETLTQDHGFPCRLYVPDIYGEKNVKWIQEIELVDYDYKGYWQERGWSDDAVINVLAAIDTPSGDTTPDENGVVAIGGVSFAGERGIDSVAISINGEDWVDTELEPYDPELVWQRWRYDWSPEPGEYRITVQATDRSGVVQDTAVREPFPDGMTGLHEVSIRVG